MDRMSVLRVVWLLMLFLRPLQTTDASQVPRFTEPLVEQTLAFLSNKFSIPTVVNCMAETSFSLVTWQNADYPKNQSLPRICQLTLKPAKRTCAYRLKFDDLDLSTTSLLSLLSVFSCPTDSPHIKIVSPAEYSGPAKCQNLTGFEGIVQLPEESREPVIIQLQTDPRKNTKFKVSVSAVPCSKINSFKSPATCGIKNQQHRNSFHSRVLTEDAMLKNPGANQEEIIEAVEEARITQQLSNEYSVESNTDNRDSRRLTLKQLKRKNKVKKNKEQVKTGSKPEEEVKFIEEAKEYAEKLEKDGNVLSYGAAIGIKTGKFNYHPNINTRVQGPSANPNEWPWMVFIVYTVKFSILGFDIVIENGCNGALLDSSHVITQASCLPGYSAFKPSLDSVNVILGDHDLADDTDTQSLKLSVSKITFPMTFSSIDVRDDIAVLTLSESVSFTDTVRPVCLPVSSNSFPDENGVLTGWQIAAANDPQIILDPNNPVPPPPFGDPDLKVADVKVLDKSICNQTISDIAEQVSIILGEISIDADEYVCLDGKDTNSAVCGVGLGTPFVQKDDTNAYYLNGISNLFSTCNTNLPNVFTAIKPDDQFLNIALD